MSPVNRQAAYMKKRELPSISYKWMNWVLPLVFTSTILFFAKDYLSNPTTLPVNKIRVHGAFVNVDEAMLYRAVSGVVAGGYFNVDVERVREVVEKLPWVNEASVRRVWPDTLSVNVVEQQPVAIAKNAGLINAKGDVFNPLDKVLKISLPVFDGNAKLNKLMLSKYNKMSALLLNIKRTITYLKIDERHAIELTLDNGLKVVLGREKTMQRLERFLSIYNKVLVSRINDIDVIDLRYTNGMAIGWKKNLKNNIATSGDVTNV